MSDYTAAVVDAIGDRRDDLVLVAQSLAGFIAPLVCTQVPVELMVLVAAMVPQRGDLVCRDDRFFPPDWLRAIVRERLTIEPDEIPGGHCAFLSQPRALADALLQCWAER